jgi:hypothetical protein
LQTQKAGLSRIFKLKLASDGPAGSFIALELVGRNYFLEAGSYTAAEAGSEKPGNYVAGHGAGEGTYWSNPDGSGASFRVVDGSLSVTKDGSYYTITGALLLENRLMTQISYSGELLFEPDPPAFTYSLAIRKPYAWTADGATWNPVPGSQLNQITIASEGLPVAYLEIVTEAGPASLAGVYPVRAEIRDAAGAVVQGVYMDLSAFVPGLVIEGGSHLIADEKEYISAGDITIADNGGLLTVSASNLSILDKATGAPRPALQSISYPDAGPEESAAGNALPLTALISASVLDQSLFGGTGFTLTLKLATEGITAEAGETGGWTFGGSGNYISIDFSRDAATLAPGTYPIVAGEAATVGNAIAGYPALFGEGYWGSVWGSVTAGAASEAPLVDGTVEVSESAGLYTLHIRATAGSEAVEAVYTGPIAI